jgi:hypothetical protein
LKIEEEYLHILEALEEDIPEMMKLQLAACKGDPFHLAIWGLDTKISGKCWLAIAGEVAQ